MSADRASTSTHGSGVPSPSSTSPSLCTRSWKSSAAMGPRKTYSCPCRRRGVIRSVGCGVTVRAVVTAGAALRPNTDGSNELSSIVLLVPEDLLSTRVLGCVLGQGVVLDHAATQLRGQFLDRHDTSLLARRVTLSGDSRGVVSVSHYVLSSQVR